MRPKDSTVSVFLFDIRLVAWAVLLIVAGLAAALLLYGLRQPNGNAISEASLAAVMSCAVIIAYSAVRAVNHIAETIEQR